MIGMSVYHCTDKFAKGFPDDDVQDSRFHRGARRDMCTHKQHKRTKRQHKADCVAHKKAVMMVVVQTLDS